MNDLFESYPSAEAAYLEAINHCHDLSGWRPSHVVVFEAGRRVNWNKLRRLASGCIKRAYIKQYEDVCKAYTRGERFMPITKNLSKRSERLSDLDLRSLRLVGLNRVNELKQLLRD